MKHLSRVGLALTASVGLLAGLLAASPAANAAPVASTTKSTSLYAELEGYTWFIDVAPVAGSKSTTVWVGDKKKSVPATWQIKDGGAGSKYGISPKPYRHFGTKRVSFYKAQAFMLDFAARPHAIGPTDVAFRKLSDFYGFYDKELKQSESKAKATYAKKQRIKATALDSQQAAASIYSYLYKHGIKSNAGLSKAVANRLIKHELSGTYKASFSYKVKFYTVNMGDGPMIMFTVYVTVKDKTDKVAYQGFINNGNASLVGSKVKY